MNHHQWIKERSRLFTTALLPFTPPQHPNVSSSNPEPPKSIMCCDWHPFTDGLLLLGSENGSTHLLNCRQNPYQSEDPLGLPQHTDPVISCKWSPSGLCFATSQSSSTITLHSTRQPSKALRTYHNGASAKKILFRTDSQILGAFKDGSIMLFDTRDPSLTPRLQLMNLHSNTSGSSGESTLTDISYHHFSEDVIMSIGHPNYDLKMWDLRYTYKGNKAVPITVVPLPTKYSPYIKKRMRAPLAIVNNPVKSMYHCVCADDTIYTHSITNNAVIHRMVAPEPPELGNTSSQKFRTSGSFFLGASLSPAGDMLACGSSEQGGGAFVWDGIGEIVDFDVDDSAPDARPPTHSYPKFRLGECRWEASCVGWSPNFDGKERIFVGGEDYLSRVWTLTNDNFVDTNEHGHYNNALFAEPLLNDCRHNHTQQLHHHHHLEESVAKSPPETVDEWPSRRAGNNGVGDGLFLLLPDEEDNALGCQIKPNQQITSKHGTTSTARKGSLNRDFLLLFN